MKNKKDIEILSKGIKDSSLTKQEYIRVLAVLKRKQGQRREEIIKFLGVSIKALEKWITAYNREGLEGLKTEKRITSSIAKLKPDEIEKIEKWLKASNPKDMDISRQDYWDVPTLKKLIKKKCGVEYKSHASYTRLFKRCGFSYQRVEFEDKRRSQKSVDEFKKRFEGKLKKGGSIVMSW